jgi:D-tyrosyl-tRNA(Tyr) deacylase
MKVLVQRVKSASVEIQEEVKAQIDKGYLLYVCLEEGDDTESVDKMIYKILNLRIFEDAEGKMNNNISQVGGAILSISQFTLSWDGSKGHRPSFEKSMKPAQAKLLYHLFNKKLAESLPLYEGVFGAEMDIISINDGPVTFQLMS